MAVYHLLELIKGNLVAAHLHERTDNGTYHIPQETVSADAEYPSAVIKTLPAGLGNMARDLFAGSVKGLNKMKAEDFADMAMNDLLRGFNPKKASKAIDVIKSNPMLDDYHTGIRDYNDVKTYREAVEEDFVGAPDYTESDARKAIETGRITVYSSKPIETGNFVTPSKMEAKSYAGGGKVYSKEISIEDVAWIDSIQGQYAPMEGESIRFRDGDEDLLYRIREEKKRATNGLKKRLRRFRSGKQSRTAPKRKRETR